MYMFCVKTVQGNLEGKMAYEEHYTTHIAVPREHSSTSWQGMCGLQQEGLQRSSGILQESSPYQPQWPRYQRWTMVSLYQTLIRLMYVPGVFRLSDQGSVRRLKGTLSHRFQCYVAMAAQNNVFCMAGQKSDQKQI